MLFEQRLARIHSVSDAEKQIQLAKAYAKRVRGASKKAQRLEEKLAINERFKIAEQTL